MPSPKGLTQAWTAAEAARPPSGTSRASCAARERPTPKIHGDGWPAWARGPHAGERVQGEGDSPEAALLDLADGLRTLA